MNTTLAERKCSVFQLAIEIGQPQLPELIRRFLYDQLYPGSVLSSSQAHLNACPAFSGLVSIVLSAVVTFYAPSDECGIDGMRRETIRASPAWRKGHARYDCAFVNSRPHLDGMQSMDVVRVLLFFSFEFESKTYPCALVRWFTLDGFDEDTGMWMVQPESLDGIPVVSVIHLDSIIRNAHLLPIYGDKPVPHNLLPHHSLDAFRAFYVNKFIDYHSFHIAS